MGHSVATHLSYRINKTVVQKIKDVVAEAKNEGISYEDLTKITFIRLLNYMGL